MDIENVTIAARAVAEARRSSEAAAAALLVAKEHDAKIGARLDSLSEQKGVISARRESGDRRPDDGSVLALIAIDSEDLRALRLDAEAMVSSATDRAASANAVEAASVDGLRRAEDQAEQDALLAHAGKLDALLLETVARLKDVSRRLGDHGRPKYGPSKELALALRKLQAERLEL